MPFCMWCVASKNSDVIHVEGKVDPISDIETIDMELMLADMQTVESAKEKAAKTARSGNAEAKSRLVVLEACGSRLENDQPIRGLEFDDPEQQKILKGYQFLTAKPVLYLANVDEDDINGEGPLVQQVRERASKEGGDVVAVCGRLESEIAELDEADRKEMLESVGLEEPALAVVAVRAYHTLGLQSYFTAGVK